MIAETIETIKTAAAAISLACPAFSFSSGIAKSTVNSSEVFINSAEITLAEHSKTIHHSTIAIFKKIPANNTRKAAKK